ncbi:MAG: MgtC/SapB family protein [Lachnospiraceae bacterium]|nr:MgtC/SapB family protein [Lachnospiraceae bacterium]MBR4174793.1 MgtC/SapB family protein [Lachnospiraceae bacterium]
MEIEEVLEFFESSNDMAVAMRLVVATLFGCLVGWEREARRHSAGIKTFALVSLGSAVATALNLYLAALPGLSADTSRIPAGVVSGIGFLGAGTILVTMKQQIKGLTTAASLWVTACMGMAIGGGYLTMGIVCFLLIMIANVILVHFREAVDEKSRYISIYIEVNKEGGVKRLTKWVKEHGYKIYSITKSRENPIQASDVGLLVSVDFEEPVSHGDFIETVGDLAYVSYIEET